MRAGCTRTSSHSCTVTATGQCAMVTAVLHGARSDETDTSALRQDTVETERIEWARETHESRDSCFTELLTLFIVVLYCKY